MSYSMTTGTYVNHFDLMEKIRDELVISGFEIESFRENLRGSGSIQRGHRLHAKKGNIFLTFAGATNAQPDWSLGADNWTTNGVSGITARIQAVSTSSNTNWNDGSYTRQTTQIGQNNTYFKFRKGNSFIFCVRFTSRKYGWIGIINKSGYNSDKNYIMLCMGEGRTTTTASPSYSSTYLGLPQFPWIGYSNQSAGSTAGENTALITDAEIYNSTVSFPNFFRNAPQNASTTSGNTMSMFGFGYPITNSYTLSNGNILQRSKTPFNDKYSLLPIEIFTGIFNSNMIKRLFLDDIYVVYLPSYEAEEILEVGNERFIILPFLEKSATGSVGVTFCYNMGVAIKIGEV